MLNKKVKTKIQWQCISISTYEEIFSSVEESWNKLFKLVNKIKLYSAEFENQFSSPFYDVQLRKIQQATFNHRNHQESRSNTYHPCPNGGKGNSQPFPRRTALVNLQKPLNKVVSKPPHCTDWTSWLLVSD